jgi:hypothetical protein
VSKTLYVIGGLALFVVCLAAFVTMSALHLDTGQLVTFIVTIWGVIGGTAGVAAWRNTEVIKEQTNGPLSATHLSVANTADRVASLESAIQDISTRMEKVNV